MRAAITKIVPRLAITLGLLSLALSLQGCVGVMVGGAAATGYTAAQDRTMGDAMDDVATKANIKGRLLTESRTLYLKTDVRVVEGRVLLAGLVPDQDARISATRVAWQAPGVKEVINELEVSDRRNIAAWPQDTWITTKLRSKLIGDADIKAVNYSIDTKDNTVYLMGIAQSQDELDRVRDHAREIGGVKDVVNYVKLKDDPTRGTSLYSASRESGGEATGSITPAATARPVLQDYGASAAPGEPGPYGGYAKGAPPAVSAPQGYADLSDKYDRPATGTPTSLPSQNKPLPPIISAPQEVESLSAPPVR